MRERPTLASIDHRPPTASPTRPSPIEVSIRRLFGLLYTYRVPSHPTQSVASTNPPPTDCQIERAFVGHSLQYSHPYSTPRLQYTNHYSPPARTSYQAPVAVGWWASPNTHYRHCSRMPTLPPTMRRRPSATFLAVGSTASTVTTIYSTPNYIHQHRLDVRNPRMHLLHLGLDRLLRVHVSRRRIAQFDCQILRSIMRAL